MFVQGTLRSDTYTDRGSCNPPASWPSVGQSRTSRINSWWKRAKSLHTALAVLDTACSDPPPPESFWRTAVNALRADEEEPVLVLVAASARQRTGTAATALAGIDGVRIAYYSNDNETLALMVDGAMLAADHIVIDHPELTRNRSAERASLQARYHAAWTWCTPPSCDGTLDADFGWAGWSVVQARGDEAAGLEVRSTLSPRWRTLPPSARGDASAAPALHLPRGMWTRPDVCIG